MMTVVSKKIVPLEMDDFKVAGDVKSPFATASIKAKKTLWRISVSLLSLFALFLTIGTVMGILARTNAMKKKTKSTPLLSEEDTPLSANFSTAMSTTSPSSHLSLRPSSLPSTMTTTASTGTGDLTTAASTSSPIAAPSASPSSSPVRLNPAWVHLGDSLFGGSPDGIEQAFGRAVALSANGLTLAVGATYDDPNGSQNAGSLTIYEFDNEAKTWSRLGNVIPGQAPDDTFGGWSIGLSHDGRTIAAGAPYNDDNGHAAGSVRAFRYNEATSEWDHFGQTLLGEDMYDNFGYGVAISANGTILAAGSSGSDGTSSVNKNYGHVRVFRYSMSSLQWEPMGQTVYGTEMGNEFGGWTVTLSGDGFIFAAGSDRNKENGQQSGRVRVFAFDEPSSTWIQIGQSITGEGKNERFGAFVSLSHDGRIMAASSIHKSTTGGSGASNSQVFLSGRVRVFELNEANTTWLRRGQSLDGEAAYDRFGRSVALSGDGNMVAVGSIFNDGNGDDSGQVKVFEYGGTDHDGTNWVQVGQVLYGDSEGDHFGITVDLSDNGETLAVGAWLDDARGHNAGQAQVFLLEQAPPPP